MISIQVGDCWLWSLIFQIHKCYCSTMFVPHIFYTLILTGGCGGEHRFMGEALERNFWDVCWPIVLQTHGIGLTVVFSPIKERIVTQLCMVL